MSPELVESKTAFATRLNISKAYVSNLVKAGLPCDAKGAVRVAASLRWIRENVNGKPGRPVGSIEGGEGGDLTAAKTRLIIAQAAKAEMDLANMRGEFIPKDVVKKGLFTFVRTHRDHMLNFANRHGPALAAELGVPPATLIGLLEARIREAIDDAAESIRVPFKTPPAVDDEPA